MSRSLSYYNRTILSLLLIGAFIWSLTVVPWNEGVIHQGGFDAAVKMIRAALMPKISTSLLATGLSAAWRTLSYAVAGISMAILFAIPVSVLASGVLARTRWGRWASRVIFRPMLALMRSIHELVWAWLFVASFGLTPFAGICAIMIPYGGILGRIYADMLNDVRDQPLDALRANGASEFQVLTYGRIPQALPDIISYTMFRLECAVRSAAIMSFIGLGGIGYQIEISLDDLHFAEAWSFTYILIALVVAITWWSHTVRKALVES